MIKWGISVRVTLFTSLAVLCVAGGVEVPREPTGRGHPMSFWVQRLDPRRIPNEVSIAEEVIRQIGTNGIPFLIFELSSEERAKKNHPTVDSIQAATSRAGLAANALGLLSNAVRPAIPQLEQLMTTGDSSTVECAAGVLGDLGPAGVKAIMSGFNNKDPETHLAAATALTATGTNVATEVPHLFKILRQGDLDDNSASMCSLAIRESGIPMPAIVSGHVKNLTAKNPKGRLEAALSLGELGTNALRAVPELQKATLDPDKDVRDRAGWALREIQQK